MVDNERVMNILFSVVDLVNKQMARDKQLEKLPDTLLIGEKSKLDSLSLINFILAVEQTVEQEFQVAIVLTENEDLIFSADGPFKTIKTLGEYIAEHLKKKK
jgi:hypothetical protein